MMIFLFLLAQASFASFYPEPKTESLNSGGKIFVFDQPSIPLVDIVFLSRKGSKQDPVKKSGLAQLWVKMLSRGNNGKTSIEVAQQIENLGASRVFSVDEDLTTLSIHGLVTDFKSLNGILSDTAFKPNFDESDFQFIKRQLLDSWSHVLDSPESILYGTLKRWLSQGTEYERGSGTSQKEFNNISVSDIKKFHSDVMCVDEQSAIVIVGPLKKFPTQWMEEIKKTWASFSCPKTKIVSIPKLKPLFKNDDEIIIAHRSGSVQSVVGISFEGPDPKSDLFFNSQVSQAALGETYNSRLNLKLREELNLTYGVESGFEINAKSSYYKVVASTATPKTSVLLTEMKDVIERFGEGPVVENEFIHAVEYMKGAYPMSMPTVYAFASKYVSQWILGRPLSEINEFQSKLEKYKFEQFSDAIRKVFLKPKFKTVIVGDSSQIILQLKKLKLKYRLIDPKVVLGVDE